MMDVDKRGWMLGPMYSMHTGQLMVENICLCLLSFADTYFVIHGYLRSQMVRRSPSYELRF